MQIVLTDALVAHRYIEFGVAHFRNNEFAHAVAAFDAALKIVPDDPYAHWNRATALLSLGDYAQGFKEHDWAWRLFHWRGFARIGDTGPLWQLPVWRGERDCKVLAYHELGYGDAIMAMRYLPEIKRRAALTLVIDQPLGRLARSFDVEVMHTLPTDLAGFDYRLPLFGVMSALDQTTGTIPAAPYIGTDLPAWVRPAGNKIGVAWLGRTQTSFTQARFLQLLAHRGFELYSLLPGPAADGAISLRPGCDFADVADLIAEMDHIVSVDTAAIHLAGAMGHPSAHLLLPRLMDWRWHRTELWYPRLKTYRQTTADDWTEPFARLNEALHGQQER